MSALASAPFFNIDVVGLPVAKGRPRVTRAGHVYTPQKTREYEERIRLQTRVLMAGRKPSTEACVVHVAVFFEPPKSLSKRKMDELMRHNGAIHIKKPDLDNVVKSALDGICGEGLAILDDKQIVEICAFKTYAEESLLQLDVFEVAEPPGVERFSNRWRSWENEVLQFPKARGSRRL